MISLIYFFKKSYNKEILSAVLWRSVLLFIILQLLLLAYLCTRMAVGLNTLSYTCLFFH